MSSRFVTFAALACVWFNLNGPSVHAYSVGDAFEALGPPGHGMTSGYQMADFMSRLLLEAELDEQTDAFLTFWQQSIRKFDMLALYNAPYLTPADNGFRAVTFHGRTLPDKFTIRLNRGEQHLRDDLAHLGNFGVEFGLKQKKSPIKNINSFEGKISARVAMKQFTHGAVAAWIDGMQHVIDPANIAALSSPPADVFDNVRGDARKPIDNYYEFFPAQTRYFDKFVAMKSFIETKTHNQQAYTRLALEISPRLPAFQKEYAHLYNYFMRVKGVFGLSLRLQTPDGLNLTIVEVDTRTHSFHWTFYTREGKLIPFNAAGEPEFSREFALNEIDQYRMKAIISGTINLYGVRVNSGETITEIQYKRLPDGAAFDLHMTQIPPPEIRGRALGVVPLFLVDVIIPSNIEDLARQFVTVMANGNGGQGTRMRLDWDESQPMDASLNAQGQTELLDNRFVNIALGLWGKRIHPDPETIGDIAKFWGLFFQTLLPDEAVAGRLPADAPK